MRDYHPIEYTRYVITHPVEYYSHIIDARYRADNAEAWEEADAGVADHQGLRVPRESLTNRCKICLKNVKGTNTLNMKSHVQKWHTNILKIIENQAKSVYEDFNDDDADISQVQNLPQAKEHPQVPCKSISITNTQWPIIDNRNTNLSSQPTIVQSIKNIEEFKERDIHSNADLLFNTDIRLIRVYIVVGFHFT
ncbi:hypothetical protein AGLY_018153 [Aphis glycines]|uniref:BED-type domain-containing protein n=1 Tax=Aphis glycines TaxID=307491 RepID=A0A6G0SSW9_APHGL|nr:hypothetical protein AGLY_018153 [Aphis glycines]